MPASNELPISTRAVLLNCGEVWIVSVALLLRAKAVVANVTDAVDASNTRVALGWSVSDPPDRLSFAPVVKKVFDVRSSVPLLRLTTVELF